MRQTLIIAAALMAAVLPSCRKEEIIRQNITVDTTIVNTTYNAEFTIADQEPVSQDIRPITLKSGDVVAVCAASNSVTESEISDGIKTLESWGLKVIKADNLLSEAADGRYAGTLEQRIKGFQAIIDNQEVRAIFMARGGYGAAQILPFIDWKGMEESPKWLIGYSDVTALHITLQNMGYETIHGPMMKGFSKDTESMNSLKDMLFGNAKDIQISANTNCISGSATARLVGGNLSLIYAMMGTAFEINTMDAILFIEDTGEANYSVDRMMLALQQSGKLQQIKGLIVGQFIQGSQGNDLPINEIIHKYVGKLGIPVVYGIQSGHDTKNLPLMMGSKVTISVDAQTARITFPKDAIAK